MARPKKIKEEVAIEETPTLTEAFGEAEQVIVKKPRARKKSKLAVGGEAFDIFANEQMAEQTRSLLAKSAMADGFKSAADINRDYLPLPWFAMQYLIGRIGIPVNTIIEFIGQENTDALSLPVHV